MESKRIYIRFTDEKINLLKSKIGEVNSYNLKRFIMSNLGNDEVYNKIDNFISNLKTGENFALQDLKEIGIPLNNKKLQSTIGKYLKSNKDLTSIKINGANRYTKI